MPVSQLKVFLNSYQSEPFISEFEGFANPFADESGLEDWVEQKSGKSINLTKQIKVEDIRHCENTTAESSIRSTLVRISLVD